MTYRTPEEPIWVLCKYEYIICCCCGCGCCCCVFVSQISRLKDLHDMLPDCCVIYPKPDPHILKPFGFLIVIVAPFCYEYLLPWLFEGSNNHPCAIHRNVTLNHPVLSVPDFSTTTPLLSTTHEMTPAALPSDSEGQPVPPDVGSATSSWNHYTQLENTVIIINQTNP